MNQKLVKFFQDKKNQRSLVECFYMGAFLIMWAQYILPYLQIQDAEPKIAIAIAGFVFFSLIVIVTVLPYWLRSFTYYVLGFTSRNKGHGT